jgi:DNA repair protein RecN (Recombination protein N)
MLNQLHIQNFALIQDLELNLKSGLNIITGETGAGKSILLGALGLLSGKRSDVSVIRGDAKKCVIEGAFKVDDYGLESFFEAHDIEFEANTIIRREIALSGKSRSFVNDSPVTLSVLKELGSFLIDIHSQHSNLVLADPKFSFLLLDSYANQKDLLAKYQVEFRVWQKVKKQLDHLLEQQKREQLNLEFNQFQLKELTDATLKAGELESLEKEFEVLNNAEEIKEYSSEVAQKILYGNGSVQNILQDCEQSLGKLSGFDEDYSELHDRLSSSLIELRDIAEDLQDRCRGLSGDANRVKTIDDRLGLLFGLQKKFNVSSVEYLIERQEELTKIIASVEGGDDDILALTKEIAVKENSLKEKASNLRKGRTKATKAINKEVISDLHLMGISQAQIDFEISDNELTSYGFDLITILFSANKGKELSGLSKTASGGELSRVMLSLKRILSSKSALPTIVFDEIDTGVSGEVADKMGGIMKYMGSTMQVLTITHLPQIAAKGDAHYKVFKSHDTAITTSQLKELNKEDRIEEIAQMLSGAKITQAALDNAAELLS